MSKKDNLHNADGNEALDIADVSEKELTEADKKNEPVISEDITPVEKEEIKEKKVESLPKKVNKKKAIVETESVEPTPSEKKKVDSHVDEIDESNAEDAEDESNVERHALETKDYHAMSME